MGTGAGQWLWAKTYIYSCCVLNIWKERNNMIFTGTVHVAVFYSSSITNDVHIWIGDIPEDGLQHRLGLQEMVDAVDA